MDTFQDTVFKLKRYWADRGAIIQEPYDVEVGAGTNVPETFLRVIGPKPYRVAYVQPSRRPADGRYGENPNRLYKHQQLQVILKPSPNDVLDQYLGSLQAIGIDLAKHDIKFEEDNWEAPTLGAWGIGWQVMLDGLEITQFTYFQQCGGIDLEMVPAEITYGLERIVAFLQNVESIYDIEWAPGFKYSDVRLADEVQGSVYNFEMANVDRLWRLLAEHEAECKELLAQYPKYPEKQRFPLLPAYEQVLKCSHLFNLLDARGAISVTERVGVIKRVRDLAVGTAKLWADQQGGSMSLDFLLEIGTEEIPHWMIPGALAQLSQIKLMGQPAQLDATPRRLVMRATNVADRTPDREQVIKGPPITSGEQAASGFAKKHGADFSSLRQTGNYYELVKSVPGRFSIDVLAEELPKIILGIQWPKAMYWTDRNGPRFIRPIRWLVALLGDQVIPFEIAGLKSGNVTRGHRQLGASSIPVTIATYESELRKNGVILGAHDRRHKIETEASALGAKLDRDLVETLTYITEFPTAIKGGFDPAYLELPAEVLTTVMRHHQKYFSVESAPGVLAPNFVAVMNTSGDPDGLVKHGNERVLKARFNDARFFWNVDQQKKLADRVDDLAKVTFQAKLGSYKEKTDRVIALVKELGGNEHAQRAALLAKCDLTTEMVKEFTDLQGVVGGLYAKAQGEPEAVSRAIYEHYQPLSMDDSIPETSEGRILALADKLDTLRSCFSIGMMPTGSKDPFALRRAAQGVVKILVEGAMEYRLDTLAQGELHAFLLERIQHYFREVRGFKYDEVNAVLKVGVSTLKDVEDRLNHLARVRPTPNFEPLAASFKRINNILKQANFTEGLVDPGMLESGPEKSLYEAYCKLPANGPLEDVAELRPYIDRFFDAVMVNAPDPKIRENRLSMLSDMLQKFSSIADFSEIVTSGDQK